MIFGAIGYSILGNSSLLPNVTILLLSDQHDEPSTSCKSDDGKVVPSILISDYLRKLMSEDFIVLLEEIPYTGELVGLWEGSIHVESTRKLYLECANNDLKNKIIPFDIRLGIIKNLDKKYSDNQILSAYIYKIYQFCVLESEYFCNFDIYKNIDNSVLNKIYLKILNKFKYFIQHNKEYLYDKIKDIPKSNELYDLIEILLSDIMEFYCIINIINLINNNNKKFVINCGLYHIEKLQNIFIKYFKFDLIKMYGKMRMNDIHDKDRINNICIEIPKK